MSHLAHSEEILEALRAEAEAGNEGVLYTFINRGAGNVRFMGNPPPGSHLSAWSLTDSDTPWSTFNDDQLIEAVRICEEACPGILFLKHRSKSTAVDKLKARFMAHSRSFEKRIAGEQRIDELIVEFSDHLPSLLDISYEAFCRIPAEQQIVLIERFNGGSIEIVIRKSLELGKHSLFDTFIDQLCENTVIDELIEAYGIACRELRKYNTDTARHIHAVLRRIFVQRGFMVGIIRQGWNTRWQRPQFEVKKGMTRYVQSFSMYVGASRSERVKVGDIVVFDPDGKVLVDNVDSKIIGVAFRVALPA